MGDQNRDIENPVLGDKIIFIKTAEETSGEYLLMKSELSPHGGVTLHYHVTFTEKFDVLEGQLHVVVAGDHKLLEVGQSAFAPLKAHHRFYFPIIREPRSSISTDCYVRWCGVVA
jgi:mannose-6-phosphate isomerase-like protein (cupin superfamily)